MKKPLIGITAPWSVETWKSDPEDGGYYYVGQPYVEAVVRAGGIPVLLCPEYTEESLHDYVKQYVQSVDGILFSGGGDVKRDSDEELPTLRGQQPVRYDFEAELMKQAYEQGVPVMGICRGFQMMVEVFGGTLAEDTITGHSQKVAPEQTWHPITIELDTALHDIVGQSDWDVNSYHIQKVGNMPKDFVLTAKAEGDIVEGMELTEKHFVGFQFHPEYLARRDDKAKAIFDRFLQSVKENMEK